MHLSKGNVQDTISLGLNSQLNKKDFLNNCIILQNNLNLKNRKDSNTTQQNL